MSFYNEITELRLKALDIRLDFVFCLTILLFFVQLAFLIALICTLGGCDLQPQL